MRRPPSRRHRVIAIATTVTAIAAVGGVWGIIEYRHWWEREIGRQVQPPAANAVADLRPIPGGAARGKAPIVLSYHDVGPNPQRSPYVVSPQEFVDQITAMKRAGYVSMNADEFTRYAAGTYTPPANSVFITFDDGTRGLYKYADLALRSVGYHGTSFLISGRVSTSTYYLTWPQIDRMASSGRWSFGGHTHALHTRADFGGTRGPSSVLTNRRRGPDGSREAMAVFTERVRGDVEESLDAFGRHGLPQPAMFAWPFSEARDPSTDRPAAAAAARAIAKAFPMRFVNTAAPDAASRRSIGADAIERLEVVAGMRPAEVLSAMRTMQTVSVDDPADGVWLVNRRKPSAVEIRDRRVGVRPGRAGSTTYTSADWIPQQSADWIDYRVDATLRAPESGRSSLRVRVGSPNEVRVMVGRSSVTVFRHRGVGADRIVDVAVGEFALAPGRDHDVRVEVAEHRTRIVVDEVVVDVPTGRGSVTGGVGADFGRAPGGEWGSLDGLRVRRLDVVNR